MSNLPANRLPSCGIGKSVTRKTITGQDFTYTVEDAVGFEVGKINRKFICLQRIQHTAPKKRIEYRFAYYMIGVKDGAKGRWVFGQFALMLAPSELKRLLYMAVAKWPDFSKLLPKLSDKG